MTPVLNAEVSPIMKDLKNIASGWDDALPRVINRPLWYVNNFIHKKLKELIWSLFINPKNRMGVKKYSLVSVYVLRYM